MLCYLRATLRAQPGMEAKVPDAERVAGIPTALRAR
jgi:hypothetical protein